MKDRAIKIHAHFALNISNIRVFIFKKINEKKKLNNDYNHWKLVVDWYSNTNQEFAKQQLLHILKIKINLNSVLFYLIILNFLKETFTTKTNYPLHQIYVVSNTGNSMYCAKRAKIIVQINFNYDTIIPTIAWECLHHMHRQPSLCKCLHNPVKHSRLENCYVHTFWRNCCFNF